MMNGGNRRERMKKRLMALAAVIALILAAFSAASAEGETYTLPIELRRDDLVSKQNRIGMVRGYKYPESYTTNPEVYEDPTIRVEFHQDAILVGEDTSYTRIYYAFVTIADPSQLRTVPADGNGFFGRTRVEGSRMAQWVNAVLAIDGDFYNSYWPGDGNKYCLRQGVVYRNTVAEILDMLLIDEDGDFHIYKAGPELADLNKEEIDGKKVINAFQFGPALVVDGQPVDDAYIMDRGHSPASAEPDINNPRMCIAQIDKLHYFVLTCWWHGMNVAQLRDLVLSITPCQTLYVLDGGNSSQIIYLGCQVNMVPGQNDRTISDAICFLSALPNEEK